MELAHNSPYISQCFVIENLNKYSFFLNLYLNYFLLISRYLQLLSFVPADPSVLIKLGEIYDSDNDKQQAFHYYSEVGNVLIILVSTCHN